MMKKLFVALLLFIVTISHAADYREAPLVIVVPESLNVLTDLPAYLGVPNLHGDSINGDSKKLNDAITAANSLGIHPYFYFPLGKYRFDSTVYVQDYMTFKSNRWQARFVSTSALPSGANMFESIAHSHVAFDGIYFTNYNVKQMNSFIQFKSEPKKCYGNAVVNCYLGYGWVKAAIMGGDANTNDSYHWNDNLRIENNIITRLFQPGYEILYNADETHGCRGINLRSSTLRSFIENNSITYTSGDGLYSQGSNAGLKDNPLIGNITLLSNYFFRNLSCVTQLGPYYAKNFIAMYNTFNYPTCNGGYCLTIQGIKKKIQFNDFNTCERTPIENTGINDDISFNTGSIKVWADSSMGVAPSSQVTAACFVEGSGFAMHITHNFIDMDRTGATANTPARFNFVKIVSRANGNSTTTQDTSYQDVNDYPAYYYIEDNTVTGITHYFTDVTNEKARYVFVRNNYITSGVLTQPVIQPYGYSWIVLGNTLNTLNSTAPTGVSFVKKASSQTDGAGEIVDNNTIIGDSWYNASVLNSYYQFRKK